MPPNVKASYKVSIHTLTRRVTAVGEGERTTGAVSIHTLTRRVTKHQQRYIGVGVFQSTPSRGG